MVAPVISAVAVAVFIERFLHCHRAQINSTEFLNGVRTVLKRNNVVEALSICDATPGPVARLVKTAILNRDHGRERVREALEEAGLAEVPRLEEKLNLLATIAQLAPLLGPARHGAGLHPDLRPDAEGRAERARRPAFQRRLAGPDLRRGGPGRRDPRARRLQLPRQPRQFHRARHGTRRHGNRATSSPKAASLEPSTMKFPRNARIFRGQLDAAPFAAVFFLLVIFMMLGSLVYTPGVLACSFPAADGLPGTDKPTVSVAIDADGRLYYENQWIEEERAERRLQDGREEVAGAANAGRASRQSRQLRDVPAPHAAGARRGHLGSLAGHAAAPLRRARGPSAP